MRRLLVFGLSLIILTVAVRSTAAQEASPQQGAWELTPTGGRGFTLDFFVHPGGTLFLRTPGRLTGSDDQGNSWQDVPLPPRAPTWRNIPSAGGLAVPHPADPNVIYANGIGGIYHTSDAAMTWTQVFPLPGEGGSWDLMFSPSDPTRVYRTVRDSLDEIQVSQARSYDGGATWEILAPKPESVTCAYRARMRVHPTDPNRLFGSHGCNDPGGQIWQSRDAGATWTVLFGLEEPLKLSIGTLRLGVATGTPPGRLYAAATYHLGPANRPTGQAAALYRSDDDGVTWTRQATFEPRAGDPERTNVTIADLAVDPFSPDRVFLAIDTSVWEGREESIQRSGVTMSPDGGLLQARPGQSGHRAVQRPQPPGDEPGRQLPLRG